MSKRKKVVGEDRSESTGQNSKGCPLHIESKFGDLKLRNTFKMKGN